MPQRARTRFQEGCVEDDFIKNKQANKQTKPPKQRTNDVEYLYALYLERCFLNIKEGAYISQTNINATTQY